VQLSMTRVRDRIELMLMADALAADAHADPETGRGALSGTSERTGSFGGPTSPAGAPARDEGRARRSGSARAGLAPGGSEGWPGGSARGGGEAWVRSEGKSAAEMPSPDVGGAALAAYYRAHSPHSTDTGADSPPEPGSRASRAGLEGFQGYQGSRLGPGGCGEGASGNGNAHKGSVEFSRDLRRVRVDADHEGRRAPGSGAGLGGGLASGGEPGSASRHDSHSGALAWREGSALSGRSFGSQTLSQLAARADSWWSQSVQLLTTPRASSVAADTGPVGGVPGGRRKRRQAREEEEAAVLPAAQRRARRVASRSLGNPVQLLRARDFLHNEEVFASWMRMAVGVSGVAMLLLAFSAMAHYNPMSHPKIHLAEVRGVGVRG